MALRISKRTKRNRRSRIRRFRATIRHFTFFCSRFASQRYSGCGQVHHWRGRAIEPNGGHPMKTPARTNGMACHSGVATSAFISVAIYVIEGGMHPLLSFAIASRSMRWHRRTAPRWFHPAGIDSAILVQHLWNGNSGCLPPAYAARIDKRRHQ